MKTRILVLLAFVVVAFGALATSFTEFYVQTTGNNLNAGSTTDNAAIKTITSGNWTNDTSATTATFFKSGEDLSGVAADMWASVNPDAATTNWFVTRITAVDDTADTITVSLSAIAGVKPATGVADTTIRVGGAWAGPASTVGFPFNFATSTLTNTSGNIARVNFKSGTVYSVAASGMTHALNGPIVFNGYTTTVTDGGRPNIDGGTGGGGYVVLTLSGNNVRIQNFEFSNNGGTSDSAMVYVSGWGSLFNNCLFRDSRGSGLSVQGAVTTVLGCEAYAVNKNNTVNFGGFVNGLANAIFKNCISHDNTTANGNGFAIGESADVIGCIAYNNGKNGFLFRGGDAVRVAFIGCESYSNAANGLDFTSATMPTVLVQNCNFLKNAAMGINNTGTGRRTGLVQNCGFGSGTMTNATGNIIATLGGIDVTGSVTYAADVTPWNSPSTGDFRIVLPAAKGAGTSAFYGGVTIGYPDIGAAQHLETVTSTGYSNPFVQ